MNKSLKKLFYRHPYDSNTNDAFFDAMKKTINTFYMQSEKYRSICEIYKFSPEDFKSMQDLHKIPVITTQYFKRNDISMKHKSITHITSSGTSGKFSTIEYSFSEILLFFMQAIRVGQANHLFSIKPTHCIVFGYQPKLDNFSGISRTAFASTFYSFTISRDYALRYKNNQYELDLERLINELQKYAKGKLPVRIIGFPSYTYFLLQQLRERKISLKLPKGSKILFGGGWKEFGKEEISKTELYRLIKETLQLDTDDIYEFFGATEHPVLYCACANKQFHIPNAARVIIRDVKTLEPLPYGKVGLVNLLTPVQSNIPIVSVMTDDLGILHEGKMCKCGNQNDILEIMGRVGVSDIKTCTSGATEYLEGK